MLTDFSIGLTDSNLDKEDAREGKEKDDSLTKVQTTESESAKLAEKKAPSEERMKPKSDTKMELSKDCRDKPSDRATKSKRNRSRSRSISQSSSSDDDSDRERSRSRNKKSSKQSSKSKTADRNKSKSKQEKKSSEPPKSSKSDKSSHSHSKHHGKIGEEKSKKLSREDETKSKSKSGSDGKANEPMDDNQLRLATDVAVSDTNEQPNKPMTGNTNESKLCVY